jgi:hypothetical protein
MRIPARTSCDINHKFLNRRYPLPALSTGCQSDVKRRRTRATCWDYQPLWVEWRQVNKEGRKVKTRNVYRKRLWKGEGEENQFFHILPQLKADGRELGEKCYFKKRKVCGCQQISIPVFILFLKIWLQQFSGRDMNSWDWSSSSVIGEREPDIIVCQRTRHVQKREKNLKKKYPPRRRRIEKQQPNKRYASAEE